MTKRNFGFLARLGVALASLLILSACNQINQPAPSKIVINGYTTDPNTGAATFSLSALDDQNQLITQGTVQSAGVTGLTAVDSTGNPISGATASATVCGQIVSQENVTAAIVLDATGSMKDNDPDEKRNEAAKAFVDRMTQGDLAGVASFSTDTTPTSGYYAIKIWQDFTGDSSPLYSAIDQATYASGGTNLWDAVYDSASWLDARPAGAVNPVALVLTDGEENSSTFADRNSAAQHAKDLGVKLYMVGLGDPSTIDFGDMQYVAAQTGGTFAAAANPNDLTQLFDGIFNASKASFCVKVTFEVNGNPPLPGTKFNGTLIVTINRRTFQADFEVVF